MDTDIDVDGIIHYHFQQMHLHAFVGNQSKQWHHFDDITVLVNEQLRSDMQWQSLQYHLFVVHRAVFDDYSAVSHDVCKQQFVVRETVRELPVRVLSESVSREC